MNIRDRVIELRRVRAGDLKPNPSQWRVHTKPQIAALQGILGSGTTMVAAEQLGHICYGMDVEPKYVAVALERMAGMGLEPRLSRS